MKKAIWSSTWLNDADNELAVEFNECVEDLLENKMVQELDNFEQHLGTSRLQHSINVAYYSFIISKKFGLDHRSAARAGILHDLFLYDWKEEKQDENHISAHPKVALKNAMEITELNDIEKDAIKRHMWPLTFVPPKYFESFIVSFVDKYCAYAEFLESFVYRTAAKSMFLNCMLSGGVYSK